MPNNHIDKICPFCQTPLKPGVRASVCSACGIPHHAECWTENGGCTTCGCTGSQARLEVEVRQEPVVTQEPPPKPVGRRLIRGVAIVGLLAVVLVGGMFGFRAFRYSGKISINPKDGAEMVWVPAGEFLMGSNDEGSEDEKPQRKVYLDGYWMYKYEVTVAQYRKFCEATVRDMPKAPDSGWIYDHPMVNVTWYDARDYAKWAGASLPTEAEWEKAARGTDGRIYPWGNTSDATKCVNSMGKELRSTQPVGSYPAGASPYGCVDMAGNVWEWCADWYDPNYYKNAPARNPKGPSEAVEVTMPGIRKVKSAHPLRGGSWDGVDDFAFACALRDLDDPTLRSSDCGFRCARTP